MKFYRLANKKRILIFLSLGLVNITFTQTNDLWKLKAENAAFSPRDCGGRFNKALVYDGKIWIGGGWNWEYMDVIPEQWCSSDGINWTRVYSMTDRYEFNIVFKNKMWQTDVYVSNTENGINWNSTSVAPCIGYSIVFKNKIWIFGTSEIYNSPDGSKWDLVMDSVPWPMRNVFGITEFDNKIWIMGGVNYPKLNETYNDVWCSSDGITWDQVTQNAAWSPRRFFTPVVYRNKIWLIAGQKITYPNDVDFGNSNEAWYSSDGEIWYEFYSNINFEPRHAPFITVFKDEILLTGGYANNEIFYNNVWTLNIEGITITSKPKCIAELNSPYFYNIHADFNQVEGQIKYRFIQSPDWMSIDSISGEITGIPTDCSSTDSKVITEAYTDNGERVSQSFILQIYNPDINAEIQAENPISFCKGDSTILATTNTFSDYFWNNGLISEKIIAKKSGNYFAIVKDYSGCIDSSNSIKIQSLPEVKISSNSKNYICSGDSLRLGTINLFESYKWPNGDTTRHTYVKNSEDYYVVVSDTNGCFDTSNTIKTKVVPLPAPVLTTSEKLCEGKMNFISTDQYYKYLWTNGEVKRNITTDKPGGYSVTVTDYRGCKNESEYAWIYYSPAVHLLSEQSSTSACIGDSVILYPDGDFNIYTWNTNENTKYISVKSSGAYNITVKDERGCVGKSDTIHIDIDNPIVHIVPDPSTSFCEGDSIILSSDQIFSSYTWNTNDTSRFLNVKESGDYFLLVTDKNGCRGFSDTLSINTISLPVADFSSEINESNQSVDFQNKSINANSYLWSFGDLTFSYESSPLHYFYSDTVTYKVDLFSYNQNCLDSVTRFIKIRGNLNTLVGTNISKTVFPNPSKGKFIVVLDNQKFLNCKLTIQNTKGEIVYKKKDVRSEFTIEIDVSHVPEGIYFLVLDKEGKIIFSEKILVTK